MTKKLDRRDFIRKSAQASLGIAVGAAVLSSCNNKKPLPDLTIYPFKTKPLQKVRMGIIGVGGMGSAHARNYARISGCQIVAVGDLKEERVKRVQELVVEAEFEKPEGYSRGENDYLRMCERNDIDLIVIATPWRWHVPMAVAAMKSGKHAATEVPAALSIDECWQLVETSEKTGNHCVMLENCNYDREEMMILNMVKKGLLGELIHADCGYLHDLRAVKHDMNGEGVWRRAHSMQRNGDLYPTHGLGPVAQCMDINRGNRFDYLVSMGSKSRGLAKYALDEFGENSPQAREKFLLGDVVTTLIRTVNGETITLTHDTSSPRPYSRNILVQGTNGIVRKYPIPQIHIEGQSPAHRWEDLSFYKDKFYHPLWIAKEGESQGAGHGGMDYLEDYRLINALLKGIEPDMDVYDAAALSCITELSEKSINQGSMPMQIPDFTRGLWKTKRVLPVMEF